ncbi:hypothetical protein niasHT_016250 [Heterodera trifolii]|uniref:ABC transporter domain-containing protein n=1 Tax=Heterodera trifolii TaxID=157864 RepID=A0ABD2LIW2_9BILA
MTRSLFSQIGLLFWKQQILMRRQKCRTVFEFIYPALLLALTIFLFSYVPMESKLEGPFNFSAMPLHGDFKDVVTEVKFTNRIEMVWICSNTKKKMLAYSYEVPFQNASKLIMDKLMRGFRNKKPDKQFSLVPLPFQNVGRMREALHKELDANYDGCREFVAGVHFSKVDTSKPTAALHYTILMPSSNKQFSWEMQLINNFWRDESEKQFEDYQIPESPPYWSSGFLSIQYAIEKAFIELANGDDALANVSLFLHRLPIPSYMNKQLATITVPLFLTTLLFLLAFSMLKDVAVERESGIMAYMSVMGLNQFAFYGSHLLIAVLKMLPFALIFASLCVIYRLIESDSFLFIALFVLFGISMLAFALFLSILCKKFPQLGPISLMAALFLYANPLFFKPDLGNVPLCLLLSLNPFFAFGSAMYIIALAEQKMKTIGWSALLQSSASKFSFGFAFLMLLFDLLLFILLAIYFASVFPPKGSPKQHPLFFLKICGIKSFSDGSESNDGTENDGERTAADGLPPNENIETDRASSEDQADIVVDRLCKRWRQPFSSSNQFSLDSLSFKAYKGQITVLLGQNGAGKTTTFSILTGLLKYNSGRVFICGIDQKKHMRECQNKIGFCPQYNPLFDYLTVKEHLEFYAGTKTGHFNGPYGKKALIQEIDSVANELHIETLLNMPARSLSGGQKRKLCVAIALIGNSSVVLLDEPSAGMDAKARLDLGDLLKNIKQDRTILLTTHYMEEADTLADRIVIIANGRLACNGSPQFLKNRFGTGYRLHIVVNAGRVNSKSGCLNVEDGQQKRFGGASAAIFAIIRKHSPGAYIENAQNPPEFTVILPVQDKKLFAGLFKEIEQIVGDQRPIKSFGLSLNSLEQVFLRVNELDGSIVQSDGDDSVDGATKLAQDLFGLRQQQFLKSFFAKLLLIGQQMSALLHGQCLWLLRNAFSTIGGLISQICAFSFLIAMLFGFNSSTVLRSLSPFENTERFSVPLQFDIPKDTELFRSFNDLADKIPHANKILIEPSALGEKNDSFVGHSDDELPLVIGASVYPNDSKMDVHALFNGIALHSPPMALSFVTNALLGLNSFAIVPAIEVYDVAYRADFGIYTATRNKDLLNKLVPVLIVMCILFALMPSFLLKMMVEERSSRFKHQLLLTRLHPIIYWASFLLLHLNIYVLFCFFISLPIFVYGILEVGRVRLPLLFALFFWIYHPWLCCASFLFKTVQSVTRALLVLIVLSIVGIGIVLLFQYLFPVADWLTTFLNIVFFLLLPPYDFIYGLYRLVYQKESLDQSLDYILSMFALGTFHWLLLFCLQSHFVVRQLNHLKCRIFNHRLYQRLRSRDFPAEEDNDVHEEREFVKQQGVENFILYINELNKYYGKVPAIDGITFGVQRDDCFGLLGVNGAGKTTTFDILSGIKFATSGTATISGVCVSKHPPIGYCPQFDALPMELTGREVLHLIAQLNGFSEVSQKTETILKCIQMDKQADKRIKHNSGGQRRRISLGVALLTCANFVLLDEPTAGIDPGTRRDVWHLIRAIRQQGTAVLLASHSMEECEALCSRIAVLNRGRLAGIGTAQHLKSRFGNSFLLSITVANPSKAIGAKLDKMVRDAMASPQCQDPLNSAILRWELPRQKGTTWSILFERAQALADQFPVKLEKATDGLPQIVDFSLTQNSLEQVFMSLTNVDA